MLLSLWIEIYISFVFSLSFWTLWRYFGYKRNIVMKMISVPFFFLFFVSFTFMSTRIISAGFVLFKLLS